MPLSKDGNVMSIPVFDAHSHAFPDAIALAAMKSLVEEALWFPIENHHDGTIGGLLASMKRAGIKRTIMCSVATRPTQVRKITDWSASVASKKVIPFASIHPDFPNPEDEVARIAALGLRGLKFHPQYMRCAIDDPRTIRIAKAAAAAGLAMVFHCGYDLGFEKDELASPQRTRALHEAVPDLRIMACHMGGWERWEEVLECLVGQDIWFETSFTLDRCPTRLLQRIFDEHPHDRILFGTDSPWADPLDDLEAFLKLRLSPASQRQMLWTNAHRFLGLNEPS